MKSRIAAARNLTVLYGNMFGDLPADAFPLKVFYMNPVHGDPPGPDDQYACAVASIGKKVFFPVAVNEQV